MKMKQRYGSEIPKWLKLLGAWRINETSIDFKWGYFSPRLGLELKLSKGGYFSKNWELDFCFIFGKFNIKLPFDSGLDTCVAPQYGIVIHNDTFWVYIGGKMDEGWNQCQQKWITWDLPWLTWIHDGHYIKNKNGEMQLMTKDMSPWEFRKESALSEESDYQYFLRSGKVQNVKATVTQEKRIWHRKWLPFVKMIKNTIDVEFNQEVGEESGSWKGGCVGCGYDMLTNETMMGTLRRMELERKF